VVGSWRPGAPPATLAAIGRQRKDILAGMYRCRPDFARGPDDAIDVAFGDIAWLPDAAKGPRMAKQGRVGMPLLRQTLSREERGA
jgi:hypothetical protein